MIGEPGGRRHRSQAWAGYVGFLSLYIVWLFAFAGCGGKGADGPVRGTPAGPGPVSPPPVPQPPLLPPPAQLLPPSPPSGSDSLGPGGSGPEGEQPPRSPTSVPSPEPLPGKVPPPVAPGLLPVASAVGVPASVTVSCDTGSVELGGPTVRVSRDGIHLTATNSTSGPLGLAVVDPQVWDSYRTIPAGRSNQVYDSFPPGPVELECRDWLGEEPTGENATLDVIDPDGLWVSDSCDTVNHVSELPSPDRGFVEAEPIDLAVGWLKQLGVIEETDTVEPAGYPDALYPRFRAIREGKTIAIVTVTRLQEEPSTPPGAPVYYFADSYQQCDGPPPNRNQPHSPHRKPVTQIIRGGCLRCFCSR